MARGRLISRTLGSSRKFAALQQTAGRLAEFAQSLYPQLVANSDDYGRMAGDAFTIKHAVFPTSRRKEAEFRTALVAMHNARLIRVYEHDGQQIIQIEQFEEHQPGLSKRTKSRFPESPVNFTEIRELPEQLNGIELKGTERNRKEKDQDQNLPPHKARRDSRSVEMLKTPEAGSEGTGLQAHRIPATVRDSEDHHPAGAVDRRRGVEGTDTGDAGEVGIRRAGSGHAGPCDESGRERPEADDWPSTVAGDPRASGEPVSSPGADRANSVDPETGGMGHRGRAHGEAPAGASAIARIRAIVREAGGAA